jgi:hypothetical protein
VAFWSSVLLGVVVRIAVSVSIVLAGMALYHAYATWQEDNYFVPPGAALSPESPHLSPLSPLSLMRCTGN